VDGARSCEQTRRLLDARQIVVWALGTTTAVVVNLAAAEYLVANWIDPRESARMAYHAQATHIAEAERFGEQLAICDVASCAVARSLLPPATCPAQAAGL
jgi:hypothetical protein